MSILARLFGRKKAREPKQLEFGVGNPAISGRGRLSFRVTAYRDCAIVRFDDESHPEFWAQLLLTRQELQELLDVPDDDD